MRVGLVVKIGMGREIDESGLVKEGGKGGWGGVGDGKKKQKKKAEKKNERETVRMRFTYVYDIWYECVRLRVCVCVPTFKPVKMNLLFPAKRVAMPTEATVNFLNFVSKF